MMVAMSLYCSHNVSQKELSEGGVFFQLALRWKIEGLHLVEFVLSQLWEMATIVDLSPAVSVFGWVTLFPGRHGGEADTIVDYLVPVEIWPLLLSAWGPLFTILILLSDCHRAIPMKWLRPVLPDETAAVR